MDLCQDESLISEVNRFRNLMILRTFSKAYSLSGLRVGDAILPDDLGDRFSRIRRPPWCVGLLSARGAQTAIEEPSYSAQMICETRTLRNTLICRLDGFQDLEPIQSVTNYFLLQLRRRTFSSSVFCEEMTRYGIFLRDCAPFGATMRDRFIRIAVQDSLKNERIVSAISKVLS